MSKIKKKLAIDNPIKFLVSLFLLAGAALLYHWYVG